MDRHDVGLPGMPSAGVPRTRPKIVGLPGFTAMPWAFDRLVTPLMRLGGLTREPVEPNPGNVFEPRPERERASGGYGRI